MLMILSLDYLHNNNFLEVKLYGEFHFVPQCSVFSHVVVDRSLSACNRFELTAGLHGILQKKQNTSSRTASSVEE
jgi:hypothetical protein